MAKFKNAESTGLVISYWLNTRFAIDFLGIWEQINNPNFNVTELFQVLVDTVELMHIYQRLKDEEQAQLGWSAKRELAIQQMKVLENMEDRKLLIESK